MRRIRTKKHRLPEAAYYGEVMVAVTACEAKRLPVFENPKIVEVFRSMLEVAVAEFGCNVPVYCFMPDHLHFIVNGLEQRSRPKVAVERFKLKTGYWLGENAPQFDWQDDFYDHIIRRSEDWRRQVQYFAFNPVRAGIVEDPMVYPFTGSIGYDLGSVLGESIIM